MHALQFKPVVATSNTVTWQQFKQCLASVAVTAKGISLEDEWSSLFQLFAKDTANERLYFSTSRDGSALLHFQRK